MRAIERLEQVPVYLSRRVRPLSRRDPGRITNLDEAERLRLEVCFEDGGCGDGGTFVFEQTDEDVFELRALPQPQQAAAGDASVVLEVRVKQRRQALRF